MSLPTNGPYNSKLVSFLNRQYIRLKDNSLKSWRGFKLAVTWSAQIVLYPIYLLVQTGRLVERQFSQRIKFRQLPSWGNTSKASHKPREQPAIEATLTTVESWLPVKVKAIATEKDTRRLVLIQQDNSLLDILNEQQQTELKKVIVYNLADYLRQRQENQQITLVKKFPNVLAPIKIDNTNILPPIRLFWEIIQWIQYSPVAMSVNLFGEVYLEPMTNDEYSFQVLRQLIAQAVDYFFGINTSKLELSSGNFPGVIEGGIPNFLALTPRESTPAKPKPSLSFVNIHENSRHWLNWEDLYKDVEIDNNVETAITATTSETSLESEIETRERDYLETEATSLGYVQHPLEKILHWLDVAVEWVENFCLNIWRFLCRKR